MRKQLSLKVFLRKEFVEGIINNNREASRFLPFKRHQFLIHFKALVSLLQNVWLCQQFITEKTVQKSFCLLLFVCLLSSFLVLLLSLLFLIISPFFSKIEKKIKIWSKINCQLFFLYQIFVRLFSLTMVKCCKLSQFPIYTVWNTLLQKLHELVQLV